MIIRQQQHQQQQFLNMIIIFVVVLLYCCCCCSVTCFTTPTSSSSSSSSLSFQKQLQQQQFGGGGGGAGGWSRIFSSLSATPPSTTMVPDTVSVGTLPDFKNVEEYISYLETIGTLPNGFATGTADGTFISVEAPLLGPLPIRATVLYVTNGPTDNWAAVFTSNQFPGAPIQVGKQRVAGGGPLHAIVINNKVSNVCANGGNGVTDSELVCTAVANALQLPGGSSTVLPSSTGVIGWRLPSSELATDVVPRAIQNLQQQIQEQQQQQTTTTTKKATAVNAARAICTTDRWPKVRSYTCPNTGARIVGIAKGAGMIEPNMATMLSYIMTDAAIPRETLQKMLKSATNDSFNSISVDGDESTSDTLVLLSSNLVQNVNEDEFEVALQQVCQGLAMDLVRNGEGTGHVIKVAVQNFPGTPLEARRLGRHIVNSPLFKCAVSGNDPNTGRLAAAIGSFMGKYKMGTDVTGLQITLGGRCIFTKGQFVLEGQEVEEELSQHMLQAQYDEHSNYPPHQRCVEITVDFGVDHNNDITTNNTTDESTTKSSAVVYGSDLTAEYVAVNADYRS